MAKKEQPKIKAAVEQFCSENPEMHFSKEEGTWFHYNGQYWENAQDNFLEETLRIWEEQELLYDVHLKSMRKLCAIKKTIHGSMNQNSEMLLNTPVGVIDLQKFDELHLAGVNHKENISDWIHSHEKYKDNCITNITRASYKPNAALPERFIKFITDLFQNDLEQITYFCKFLVLCFTGLITQQFIHILYGIGRNGKSTLLSIIQHIMGSYVGSLCNATIISQKDDGHARHVLFRNRHKNLIIFNELSDKEKLNLPLIKQLTGDDFIPVENNRQDKEFKVRSKTLLNTNFIPEVGSIENRGIWDRLRILITRPPIPEEQRIDEYYKIFIEEGDQILTYLIDMYLADVLANGLKEKPEIMVFTKAYKEFSENPVEFFFDRTCKLGHNPVNSRQWQQARFLYNQYCQFHLLTSKAFDRILKIRENNESRKALVPLVSEPIFAKQMTKLGAVRIKDGVMIYKNIYFSGERVYSVLGEMVENQNMAAFKTAFIDFYENGYILKRQIDEINTPVSQLEAMGQMINETEDYFEEPVSTSSTNNVVNTIAMYKLLENK